MTSDRFLICNVSYTKIGEISNLTQPAVLGSLYLQFSKIVTYYNYDGCWWKLYRDDFKLLSR